MVTLEIRLSDGEILTVDVSSYDANQYEEKMNDREIFMVAIGDIVINKNMIRTIQPISTT